MAHSSGLGKHWFLLFNDIFVHAGYASHIVHNLQTLWVESHPASHSKLQFTYFDSEQLFGPESLENYCPLFLLQLKIWRLPWLCQKKL